MKDIELKIKQFNLLYRLKQLRDDEILEISELKIKSEVDIRKNIKQVLFILAKHYNEKHYFKINPNDVNLKEIYFEDNRLRPKCRTSPDGDNYISRFWNEDVLYGSYTTSEKSGLYLDNFVISTPDATVDFGYLWDFIDEFDEEYPILAYFEFFIIKYKLAINDNLETYVSLCQHIIDENYDIETIDKLHKLTDDVYFNKRYRSKVVNFKKMKDKIKLIKYINKLINNNEGEK